MFCIIFVVKNYNIYMISKGFLKFKLA